MKQIFKKFTSFLMAFSVAAATVYFTEPNSGPYQLSAETASGSEEFKYVQDDLTILYSVENGEVIINKCMNSNLNLPEWMKYKVDAVNIPETIDGCPVTVINDYAISELNYPELSLPDTIRQIGNHALGSYLPKDADTVFTFPKNTEEIGDYPFTRFSGKKIIIPEKTSKLSKTALVFPENDAYILSESSKVFYDVEESNPYFYNQDGAILSADNSILYIYTSETAKNKFVVPENTKEICENAFEWAHIDEIVLPDNLESLGNRVFNKSYVKKTKIPDSIVNIPRRTFISCSKLSDVTLPENLISIGTEAFKGCIMLDRIKLGNSFEKMEANAFTNAKVTCFEVASGNKYFSSEHGVLFDRKKETLIMFAKNSDLLSYSVPQTVVTIKADAFKQAGTLTEVILPDSLQNIETAAFSECTSLVSIIIPSGVKTINEKTFAGCTSLSDVIISEGTEIINDYAFKGTAIHSITIPKSVHLLSEIAFLECSDLDSIKIPSHIYGFTKYSVPDDVDISLTDEDEVSVVDGVIFSKDMKTLINFSIFSDRNINGNSVSLKNTSFFEYIVPDTVTEIADYAFSNSAIINIVLPKNLLKIGSYAFKNSTYLENVDFNGSSPEIGNGLFYGCKSLYKFITPENIKEIPENTFSECINIVSSELPDGVTKLLKDSMPCTIKQIYIPSSVTYIDDEAFNLSNLKLICAPKDSYAEKFANEHKIKFVSDTMENINGDVNADGTTNITDLITLKSVLLNNETGTNYSTDINKDGKTSVLDAAGLIDVLYGKPLLKGYNDIKTNIEIIDNSSRSKLIGKFFTTQNEVDDFFASYVKDTETAKIYSEKYGQYLDNYVLYLNIDLYRNYLTNAELYSLNDNSFTVNIIYSSHNIDSYYLYSVMIPRSLYNDQTVDYYNIEDEKNKAAKPVIYLYPEEKTDINVKVLLDDSAEFTYTYPKYPEKEGWNVTAEPDSTLTDESGMKYPYLFWEAETTTRWDMSDGFVIKGDETKEFLTEKLQYLGLNQNEYDEFIEFWLPKMQDNNYNLIKFQTDDYEKMAPLEVTPQPDSVQRIYMTFKPLDEWIFVPEQTLTPFERHGYTLIEWGGSELKNTR